MVYEWDDKQDDCYRLYVQERKSLDEVMDYFKVHGFAPRYVEPFLPVWSFRRFWRLRRVREAICDVALYLHLAPRRWSCTALLDCLYTRQIVNCVANMATSLAVDVYSTSPLSLSTTNCTAQANIMRTVNAHSRRNSSAGTSLRSSTLRTRTISLSLG